MRKYLPTYLFFLVAALAPNFANAATFSGWGKITEIRVDQGGTYIRIKFSLPIKNPEGCSGEGYYITEMAGLENPDRFISTVLSAAHAQSLVEFWIEGCTSKAFSGATRPLARSITVKTGS